MNAELNNWLQVLFRWSHVVAGIVWIGHLYFFNWVNAQVVKALDGPTKKAVVPELMPRALYWFRWGAAWTWITGILLAGLIYYMGGALFEDAARTDEWLWLAIVMVALAVGFVIYNAIMKAVKNLIVANTIVLLIFAAVYLFLEYVGGFSGRALYTHAGAILGTMMALNVWMVIWPAQKKIIAATREGTAPDAALVARSGQRSRHNTFMSVPLVFLMVSNHYPTLYGSSYRDAYLALIIAIGFVATILLFKNSARPSTTRF
jgi:uncharacterized membrane protein